MLALGSAWWAKRGAWPSLESVASFQAKPLNSATGNAYPNDIVTGEVGAGGDQPLLAKTRGRVKKVFFMGGEYVHPGDVLVKLFNYSFVLAPRNGFLGRLQVYPGQYLTATTPVTTISQKGHLVVVLPQQNRATTLHPGDSVRVWVAARPNRVFTGVVSPAGSTGAETPAVEITLGPGAPFRIGEQYFLEITATSDFGILSAAKARYFYYHTQLADEAARLRRVVPGGALQQPDTAAVTRYVQQHQRASQSLLTHAQQQVEPASRADCYGTPRGYTLAEVHHMLYVGLEKLLAHFEQTFPEHLNLTTPLSYRRRVQALTNVQAPLSAVLLALPGSEGLPERLTGPVIECLNRLHITAQDTRLCYQDLLYPRLLLHELHARSQQGYSSRRLCTGLLRAARRAWPPTVSQARSKAPSPALAKYHQRRSMRYAKSASQWRMSR